ncbi:hypothetical protein WAK64_02565 [Bacillus spongiae]|uniref:Uncharacterized protein n=1 Tax=Bacillus spongiae TaxID=2683610 RepID=A0ABU8H9E9_9BACI
MQGDYRYEMIILPTDYGDIKVYIYGFEPFCKWGHVIAQYKQNVASSKGCNRKQTIIRTMTMLHHSIVKEG